MAAASSTICVSAATVSPSFVGGLSSSRGAVNGTSLALPVRSGVSARSAGVVSCRAEKAEQGNAQVANVSRRLALSLLAGAAAVSSRVNPASAAYGESANIFAAPKVDSGFTEYKGEGFKVSFPSKWNPSKEVEFPGQVVRYEDNFDAVSNFSVSIVKADKPSIKDYGSPENLLKSLSYLLGKQSYAGKTTSEGGFETDKVSTAAVLDSEVKEVGGKTYYVVSVLTRTADGDEGGRHQFVVATIDDGKLYVCKAQAGDKRWFKGAKKFVEGVANSFNVV